MALHLLNNKRDILRAIEARYGITVQVLIGEADLAASEFNLEKMRRSDRNERSDRSDRNEDRSRSSVRLRETMAISLQGTTGQNVCRSRCADRRSGRQWITLLLRCRKREDAPREGTIPIAAKTVAAAAAVADVIAAHAVIARRSHRMPISIRRKKWLSPTVCPQRQRHRLIDRINPDATLASAVDAPVAAAAWRASR